MQLRARKCKKDIDWGMQVNLLEEIAQANSSLLEKLGTKFIYMSPQLSWSAA